MMKRLFLILLTLLILFSMSSNANALSDCIYSEAYREGEVPVDAQYCSQIGYPLPGVCDEMAGGMADVCINAGYETGMGFGPPCRCKCSTCDEITYFAQGDGAGSISGTGLNCDGSSCSATLRSGQSTELSVQAEPNGDNYCNFFAGFSGGGGCSEAFSSTCTVQGGGRISVQANFERVNCPSISSITAEVINGNQNSVSVQCNATIAGLESGKS